MKSFLSLLLFLFFTSLVAAEQPGHKTIIVGSFLLKKDAVIQKEKLRKWAMSNTRIRELKAQYGFYFVTRKSGPYQIVAIEPIKNEQAVNELFEIIKPVYIDAFVSRVRSNALLASYARGIIPDQMKMVKTEQETMVKEDEHTVDAQDVSARPVKEEQVTTVVSPKQRVSPAATEPQTENAITMPALFFGVFALAVLVFYLLIRQRKAAEHVKSIEEKVHALNDSNNELNSENLEYKDSIVEQEGLIEEMSGKLKYPAKEILGKADKIIDTDLTDKQSIELRNIQESGQVLFAIVDDLLDFMKIRANKLEISVKPFNINELLDIIVSSVLERIEKKDVEVIFDIEKSVPPRIIGDPIRIGQVLTNLLENGIKFTNSGEVKLHVKKLGESEEGIQLMFEIIDTGIGIPESRLDDIFTPFYQIKNNNSAGLGLSISKALVEMMGGEILVSTELNRGSVFTFVLELQEVNADEKRHYRLPDSAYKTRKVLILDYHDNAASAMRKFLEYFHNEVDIFSQSELESMAPDLKKYDMIFISEKLLNFELIKQIEPLRERDLLKVVVVSSMLHKANKTNVIEKLADSRIMKPVNQQTIFELLIDLYGDEAIGSLSIPTENDTSVSMPRIVIERTQKLDVNKDDFVVFRDARILVAEDNLINQKVISALLKESGMTIDMAENGKVALEMAESIEYDLILMDVNMPVMNGYEATERLKASPKTSLIPVVALTGSTMPDEIRAMSACGMDDRLEKPIKIPELFSVFSKYLSVQPLEEDISADVLPDQFYSYEDGLERCGGDKELYKDIVGEFMRLYKHSDRSFEKFYEAKDAQAIKEMSLDIKGVGANIGAYGLAVAAKKINQSSLASTSMPRFIENYKKSLQQTLNALTSFA